MSEHHMRRGKGIELTPEEQERLGRCMESETDYWTALDQTVGKSRADRIVGAEAARKIAESAQQSTVVEDAAAKARAERDAQAFSVGREILQEDEKHPTDEI